MLDIARELNVPVLMQNVNHTYFEMSFREGASKEQPRDAEMMKLFESYQQTDEVYRIAISTSHHCRAVALLTSTRTLSGVRARVHTVRRCSSGESSRIEGSSSKS